MGCTCKNTIDELLLERREAKILIRELRGKLARRELAIAVLEAGVVEPGCSCWVHQQKNKEAN